jgi:hypothetical protein
MNKRLRLNQLVPGTIYRVGRDGIAQPYCGCYVLAVVPYPEDRETVGAHVVAMSDGLPPIDKDPCYATPADNDIWFHEL